MHWGEDPSLRVLTPVGNDAFFFRTEYAQCAASAMRPAQSCAVHGSSRREIR
jgi:hypothetical protein